MLHKPKPVGMIWGEWVEIADIPQARIEAMTTVANGKIYVVGGFYDSTWAAGNRVHVYDPVSDEWTQLAKLAYYPHTCGNRGGWKQYLGCGWV